VRVAAGGGPPPEIAAGGADGPFESGGAAVDADAEAGAALGVNSTPTFYLDGKRLELARYTDLADAVEAALADAR